MFVMDMIRNWRFRKQSQKQREVLRKLPFLKREEEILFKEKEEIKSLLANSSRSEYRKKLEKKLQQIDSELEEIEKELEEQKKKAAQLDLADLI